MTRLRVALCQLNTVVGDLDGNVERIVDALEQAEAAGCDLVAFPELAITGYPPEDLLLKPGFVADNRAALQKVAAAHRPVRGDRRLRRRRARPLQRGGRVRATARCSASTASACLPNYAVFDEQRYFTAGQRAARAVS